MHCEVEITVRIVAYAVTTGDSTHASYRAMPQTDSFNTQPTRAEQENSRKATNAVCCVMLPRVPRLSSV
jgi:hypothetical protein